MPSIEQTFIKCNTKRGEHCAPLFALALVLLSLGAEIEGHHHRDDDHCVVRGDVASETEDSEDADDHQSDDGLNLDQCGEILHDIHMFSSFSG